MTAAFGLSLVALAASPLPLELVVDLDPRRLEATALSVGECAALGGASVCSLGVRPFGEEPWRIDRDGRGTLLADIVPGADGSKPIGFRAFGSRLVFAVPDRVTLDGRIFWTDGTEEGTGEIPPPVPGWTARQHFLVLGDRLLVAARDPEHGQELWSLGRDGRWTLVRDAWPGKGSGTVELLHASAARAWFVAEERENAGALWVTDGTKEGTRVVAPLPRDDAEIEARWQFLSTRSGLVDETLVFYACGDEGCEPWRSDGTPAGTHLLMDIATGAHGTAPFEAVSSQAHGEWVRAGRYLFFPAARDRRSEVWRTDGTREGTRAIDPGPRWHGTITRLVASGARVFVTSSHVTSWDMSSPHARPQARGHETQLSVIDGDAMRMQRVPEDAPPGQGWTLGGMVSLGDGRVAAGFQMPEAAQKTDPSLPRSGAFVTDGSRAGTQLLETSSLAYVGNAAFGGGRFLLHAKDQGRWLVSDLTVGGTHPLKLPTFGADGGGGWVHAHANGFFLFGAVPDQRQATLRLWAGNAPDAIRPFELDPPAVFREVRAGLAGSRLVFSDGESRPGAESSSVLWISDGTADGTIPLPYGRGASQFVGDGIHVWFIAGSIHSPNETIWRSDGTAAGTIDTGFEMRFLPRGEMVRGRFLGADIDADGVHHGWFDPKVLDWVHIRGMPREYGLARSTVWRGARHLSFLPTAETAIRKIQIWRLSDSLEEATHVVTLPWWSASYAPIAAAGDHLYVFCGAGGDHDAHGVCAIDGTTLTPVTVVETPPLYPRQPTRFAAVGDRMIFPWSTPEAGVELFVSEGTRETTRLLADIAPGPLSSVKDEPLVSAGGALYFPATDGSGPIRLWCTDGTPEGTHEVRFSGAREIPRDPAAMFVFGEHLYFSAWTATTGRELWRVKLPRPGVTP